MVLPDPHPTSTCPKSFRDYVTPHKISLLVVLKEYCFVKHHNIRKRLNQMVSNEVTWVHTAEQSRQFTIVFLRLLQHPDLDLHNLIAAMNVVLHPETYDLFLDRLNIIRSNGIAALLDFFATLDSLLIEAAPLVPVIQKSSVLGLFVRHMLLAFDKLTFSLQTKLCKQFHAYFDDAFEPYMMVDEHGNVEMHNEAETEHESEEGDDEESPSEEFEEVVASQRQSELFIAQQAAVMQYNADEIMSPIDLQNKLIELVKGNPELYEACFLSYMNLMRIKEYRGAKDNLFHHFDRNTAVPQDPKTSAPSEDLTRSSRYAALNLAIMHVFFGHKDKAIASLNEAIMLAQEVNDNICLQFSLVEKNIRDNFHVKVYKASTEQYQAWLYRLTDGDKEIMIERSVAKSIELGLFALSSLSIQALSKYKSETTAVPESVLELLGKSEIQNCQHSMTEMMGSAYMMRSGMWHYYGNSKMGTLISETLLGLNTADPSRGGIYHIGEGFCVALRNLIVGFSLKGYHYHADLVIALCRIIYPPETEYSHHWQLAEQMMKFELAIYHSQWGKAKEHQLGIAIFDKNEARYRKAQLLFNQGNIHEADIILKNLLNDLESGPVSPHFYVRTLLLRAELLYNTPNKENALPILMDCLAICKAHYILGLECLTTIHIARAELELGCIEKAYFMLLRISIPIMVTGAPIDKGHFYYLIARCKATPALLNLRSDFYRWRRVLFRCLKYFDRAIRWFMRCQAIKKIKVVFAYKARIFHHLGMKEYRNFAAFRHRYIEDDYQR